MMGAAASDTTSGARDMIRSIGKFGRWLAAAAILLGSVPSASAQVFAGRIDVTVEDSKGGRLPGVTLNVSGPLNQTQVTDAQGQAHFLNLPVGMYAVRATISGFRPYSNATIQVVSGTPGDFPVPLPL